MTHYRALARAVAVAILAISLTGTNVVAQSRDVTIRAGTLIDGRGGVQRNVVITVRGSKIVRVSPVSISPSSATYDLSAFTVLPGLIDTHVHLDSHFGADGRAQNTGEAPVVRLRAATDNAYLTLTAGFTAVQSIGAAIDSSLRALVEKGGVPGPRIFTSLGSLSDTSRTPDQIRQWVRSQANAGADLLKVFASKSIREGGDQTLSDAQIAAACAEARALNKRIWIHAHAASAVRAAANAGCWAVTHGSQVSNAELTLMAQKGTFFEPNIGLVTQNYIEHKWRYLGIGNYDEAGFRFMEEGIPRKLEMFSRAMKVPGLKLLSGTDATAGAHGQNARETVYRVQVAGQSPGDAIKSITSRAAESLGMTGKLGVIAPGAEADIIAVRGDPLTDITALQRVSFVMKAGRVELGLAPYFEQVQPDLFGAGNTLANAFADYDKDGDLDLFVGFNGEPNRLYRNDKGVFTDVGAAAGVADPRATRASAWGDYDGDGDADLIVGFAPGRESLLKLYRNDGGRFTNVTTAARVARDSGAVRQFSWIDLDADGDNDLFVAMRDRPNLFYRNDGGVFTDIAAQIGLADTRRTVGAVWFDFDGDFDLDLYVANQDGDKNGLFRNDNGRFTDVADAAGVAWGGRTPGDATNGTVRPCVADVNNDGRLDIFSANYGKNGLFLNRGDGKFEDVSAAWGIAMDSRYDACAFEDFDNDGRIDLYVNGTVGAGVSYRDFLYRNTGTSFENVTPANLTILPADHGVQWADIDADGDMDLALTGQALGGMHVMMRNMLPADQLARSIKVRVLDFDGHAVHAGAEVRLYAAGTRRLLGMRIIDTGSGYNAQNDAPVHFGIPAGEKLVDIEVTARNAGERRIVGLMKVNPAEFRGRAAEIRMPRVTR